MAGLGCSLVTAVVLAAVSASPASAAVTVTRTGTTVAITGPSAGGDLFVSALNAHRLSISDLDEGTVTAGSGCIAVDGRVTCDTGAQAFSALTIDFSTATADTAVTLDHGILVAGGVATVTFGAGRDFFKDQGDTSNVVHGGVGDDYLIGGDGTDTLYGDGGDDSLVGNDGADQLDGGANADFVRAATSRISRNDPDVSISCGTGEDSAWADFGDPTPSACEEIAPGLKSEPVRTGTPNVGNSLNVSVPEAYRTDGPPFVYWLSGPTSSMLSSPIGDGPSLYLSKGLEGQYVNFQIGLGQAFGNNGSKTWTHVGEPVLVGPGTETTPDVPPTPTRPDTEPPTKAPSPLPGRTGTRTAQAEATAKLGVAASPLTTLKLPSGCLAHARGDALRGRGLVYRRSAVKALTVDCDRAFTVNSRWTISYTPRKARAHRKSLTTPAVTSAQTSAATVAVPLTLTRTQLLRLRNARSITARVTLAVSAAPAQTITARKTFPLALRR